MILACVQLEKMGIENAKKEGRYKGRKPIEVSEAAFKEQLDFVNKKIITSKEAARTLGISIDKYYRYRKKLLDKDSKK